MGRVPGRPHPAEAPGEANRPGRGGDLPGLGRERIYHRADAAGGRRHYHRRNQGLTEKKIKRLLLIEKYSMLTKPNFCSIVPVQTETSLGEAAVMETGHCPETSKDAKG